jgi:hypothetical protein
VFWFVLLEDDPARAVVRATIQLIEQGIGKMPHSKAELLLEHSPPWIFPSAWLRHRASNLMQALRELQGDFERYLMQGKGTKKRGRRCLFR